ncbi:MAG: diguanylate cyclase [Lachnospiraceae bacterium]|nr:diguanylate cyclase [Lachnospiraceae bacterium]
MDKILIIEDSRAQAEYLKSILTADYEVTICLTGEEGFRKAKGEAFSLIFLDIILPDVDGFTLLRRFQDTALTRRTPVILVSGLSDVQHEEKGLTLGAVDYITKPFSPITVRARANIHIKLHHYQMQFMQMATVDQLTGVANRRRYEDESILKWREATRLKLFLSVCMFDIDKFKVYNDTFGHPAGDKVIAAVARTASAFLQRSTDFFGRYGGEEFVAILIGNEARAAFDFLKSIRQAVEDLHIPHAPSVSPWVTISIGGVTLLPKDGDSYEYYLEIADNMLYKAKHSGRNMVVWSDSGREEWLEEGREKQLHSPAVQA